MNAEIRGTDTIACNVDPSLVASFLSRGERIADSGPRFFFPFFAITARQPRFYEPSPHLPILCLYCFLDFPLFFALPLSDFTLLTVGNRQFSLSRGRLILLQPPLCEFRLPPFYRGGLCTPNLYPLAPVYWLSLFFWLSYLLEPPDFYSITRLGDRPTSLNQGGGTCDFTT